MDQPVREFLEKHRTAARWLDDIIDQLIERGGKAHVNTIARELAKSWLRDVNTVEQTVTRRINDFCSTAADFEKSEEYDLFERVAPATYRLRAYPDRPDIIELIRIEFDDPTMQSLWQHFSDSARKQHLAKWRDLSNERRLSVFVKWMSKDEVYAEYEKRKMAMDAIPSEEA